MGCDFSKLLPDWVSAALDTLKCFRPDSDKSRLWRQKQQMFTSQVFRKDSLPVHTWLSHPFDVEPLLYFKANYKDVL